MPWVRPSKGKKKKKIAAREANLETEKGLAVVYRVVPREGKR